MSSNLSYADTLDNKNNGRIYCDSNFRSVEVQKKIWITCFNSNLNFGATTTHYLLSNLEIFTIAYGNEEVLQRVKSIV